MVGNAAPGRRLFTAAAGLAAFLVPAVAFAQSCPANTVEVSRERVGSKLTLRCACISGLVQSGNRCVTVDEAARGNPLDPELVDLFLNGYGGGPALRAAADRSTWPLFDKFKVQLAALMAESGAFAPAVVEIEIVGPDANRDPAVLAARQAIEALKRKEAQLFTLMRPESGRVVHDLAIGHMPMEARANFLIGVLGFRLGDYRQSLTALKRARDLVPGDKGIDESMVIVRAVQSAAEDRRQPEAAARRYAMAFRGAGAQAAMFLGAQLIGSGDYAGAEVALGEARQRMGRLPETSPSLLSLVEGLRARTREDRAKSDRSMVDPPGQRPFDRVSKADLMFSALEYGQKDWARSLFYLETAMRADPGNATVRKAYEELKEIAASVK